MVSYKYLSKIPTMNFYTSRGLTHWSANCNNIDNSLEENVTCYWWGIDVEIFKVNS